jgi:fatty acid desaturase
LNEQTKVVIAMAENTPVFLYVLFLFLYGLAGAVEDFFNWLFFWVMGLIGFFIFRCCYDYYDYEFEKKHDMSNCSRAC